MMMKKLHIFAVSDSVGETAERLAVASITQYEVVKSITRISRVQKEEQIEKIIDQAVNEDAIIVYTIVKTNLVSLLESKAKEKGVITINALAPLMEAIQAKTGLEPSNIVGLTHKKDEKYFSRIEAIEWAIDHDDGKNLDNFKEADLIILGLPGTSKTPLSMHLANFGLKVANFNIKLKSQIPPEIMEIKGKVPMVGLTLEMEELFELRMKKLKEDEIPDDIDRFEDLVAEERDLAFRFFKKLECPVIDVTLDDIEETANTITRKFTFPLEVKRSKVL